MVFLYPRFEVRPKLFGNRPRLFGLTRGERVLTNFDCILYSLPVLDVGSHRVLVNPVNPYLTSV